MSEDARTDERTAGRLAAALLPTPADLDGLRARLAGRADDEGILDVAYRSVDSPIGSLLVAATAEGLVRVAFELEGHDAVVEELAASISPRVLRTGRRTDEVARQLEGYFDGRRRHFEIPVDLRLAHGFRRNVLTHLIEIPFGATESYAAVAAATGNPRAVRAVGGACAHNPVPLVVPCHRVVRSDGSTGQYRGGAEVKVALLAMEAQALRSND